MRKSPYQPKHTPGPWEAWTRTPGVFVPESGIEIVHPNHMSRSRSEAEQMANARLIASAPELLEALKDIVFFGTVQGMRLAKAQAAIAKAEGREVPHA